uniref:Potassium channel, subfamily K, member 13b n=1 Tax=Oryzias sinensis TaxID=183150 RepID=A0A8C7YAB7_9TELE
ILIFIIYNSFRQHKDHKQKQGCIKISVSQAGLLISILNRHSNRRGVFRISTHSMFCAPGFGMTTPATIAGKVFLMFYGLLGCAATILFFNLFLERVITVIAFVLKSCHRRRHNKAMLPKNGRCASVEERASGPGSSGSGKGGGDLAGWKPSVYCVMLILGAAAVLVSCCASLMYSAAEGWAYLDSLYFCFVAFSTIGFGDMVSSQRVSYEGYTMAAYRLGNFFFILTGVCCIYSLFNVISIVIKQVLNWLLRRLETPCRCCFPRRGIHPHRHPRRNVVAPGHLRARREPSIETDAINESETDPGRRMSGEMISMRDFLAANKVSSLKLIKVLPDENICKTTCREMVFSSMVWILFISSNQNKKYTNKLFFLISR